MQFRVAEFKRAKKGKVFKGFAYSGYYLTNDGKLQHCNKKVSSDKRRNNYVELNIKVGQKDIKGVDLYVNDIVHEHKWDVKGYINYVPQYGGFFTIKDFGLMKNRYFLLNSREYEFEKVGTIYEDIHL